MKPRERILEAFRKLEGYPDIILILHCDGAVSKLLDDIREIGYEVFNPVQPEVPEYLLKDLKKRFGDKFVFWGAIYPPYFHTSWYCIAV